MTDKKTFKGFPLDSRGDVIGAFPTVDVIQERTKDLINEVTGNINQMTIDYCLKINIDPDVLIKQKAEIELLHMKIADIKANCDLAIEGRDIKITELEQELTVEKDQHQEEVELHLHAEEYIKSLERQIEKLKADLNNAIESASKWYVTDPIYSLLVDIYNDNFELKEIKQNDR